MTPLDATLAEPYKPCSYTLLAEAGYRQRSRQRADGDIYTDRCLSWTGYVSYLGTEPGYNDRLGVSSRAGCRAGVRLRGPRYLLQAGGGSR